MLTKKQKGPLATEVTLNKAACIEAEYFVTCSLEAADRACAQKHSNIDTNKTARLDSPSNALNVR